MPHEIKRKFEIIMDGLRDDLPDGLRPIVHATIQLTQQVILDMNRIADSMVILASERITLDFEAQKKAEESKQAELPLKE